MFWVISLSLRQKISITGVHWPSNFFPVPEFIIAIHYKMLENTISITIEIIFIKVKSSPTGHAGPEGSRRVKAPSFRDDTVKVVGCQPYAPAAFTPRTIPDDRKHTWYSFMLEAESTPGP